MKGSLLKKILLILLLIGMVCFATILAIYTYISWSSARYIHSSLDELPRDAQAIMILGSKVYTDGRLGAAVQERVDTAIDVYRAGIVDTILVSGDNGTRGYDEVSTIRNYLLKQDIPTEDIFLDYAGFDTYDSMYRADFIFGIKRLLISTQQFHLSRAVYIARGLGIDAGGIVAANPTHMPYKRHVVRELGARMKAWGEVTFGSRPHHFGDPIPIDGPSNG